MEHIIIHRVERANYSTCSLSRKR